MKIPETFFSFCFPWHFERIFFAFDITEGANERVGKLTDLISIRKSSNTARDRRPLWSIINCVLKNPRRDDATEFPWQHFPFTLTRLCNSTLRNKHIFFVFSRLAIKGPGSELRCKQSRCGSNASLRHDRFESTWNTLRWRSRSYCQQFTVLGGNCIRCQSGRSENARRRCHGRCKPDNDLQFHGNVIFIHSIPLRLKRPL